MPPTLQGSLLLRFFFAFVLAALYVVFCVSCASCESLQTALPFGLKPTVMPVQQSTL